jgi:hypothetical protein
VERRNEERRERDEEGYINKQMKTEGKREIK